MGKLGDFIHDFQYASNDRYRTLHDQKEYGMILDRVNDKIDMRQPMPVINAMIDSRNPNAINAAMTMLDKVHASDQQIRQTEAGINPWIEGEAPHKDANGVAYGGRMHKFEGFTRIAGVDTIPYQKHTDSAGFEYYVDPQQRKQYMFRPGDDIKGDMIRPAFSSEWIPISQWQEMRRAGGENAKSKFREQGGNTAKGTPDSAAGQVTKKTGPLPAPDFEQASTTGDFGNYKEFADSISRPVFGDVTGGKRYSKEDLQNNPKLFEIPDSMYLPVDIRGENINPYDVRILDLIRNNSPKTGKGGNRYAAKLEQEQFEEKLDILRTKKVEWAKDNQIIRTSFNRTGELYAALDVARKRAHPLSTGIAGSNIPPIKGLEASQLQAQLEPIRAKIALDALIWLRDSSKTGAGLGTTSDAEMRLLQDSIASLNTVQNTQTFMEALDKVEQSYDRILALRSSGYRTKHNMEVPYYNPSSEFDSFYSMTEAEKTQAMVDASRRATGELNSVVKSVIGIVGAAYRRVTDPNERQKIVDQIKHEWNMSQEEAEAALNNGPISQYNDPYHNPALVQPPINNSMTIGPGASGVP